jgi:hypothetical protein
MTWLYKYRSYQVVVIWKHMDPPCSIAHVLPWLSETYGSTMFYCGTPLPSLHGTFSIQIAEYRTNQTFCGGPHTDGRHARPASSDRARTHETEESWACFRFRRRDAIVPRLLHASAKLRSLGPSALAPDWMHPLVLVYILYI